MTGFASAEGQQDGWRWSWDIRAVNGRGLDIRLRIPDQIDGLDAALRSAVQKVASRGNVTLGLKLTREATNGPGVLNQEALTLTLQLLGRIEEAAAASDLRLRDTSAAEILALKGVMETNTGTDDEMGPLREALLAGIAPLVSEFDATRAKEGAALESVIAGQVATIAELAAAARSLLGQRSAQMEESFRAALARIRETAETLDEARIAQEMAVVAIKADVAEELDRLDAHVDAARALLAGPGPKGRKLDFLTQEFNREANTLCSKAQFAELTRIGLDLKHAIDQMREQVQNVE